ncbi:hypothetical protein E3N88_43851 [Mikania micrantha]|uniref:PHD-type domain-containing protein n=1 Tax=Mikania micrantha TaxID=192012 RepID=A0A5N6LDQ7_9ASTR|nr:hypothetical protein E3N88_43851 [Mikania micrantha]
MARNRVRSDWKRIGKGDQDLDESDEEYKVTDDEDSEESDECYSLDGEESEEMSDDFGKSKRVSRSKNTRRMSSGKKVNEMKKPRKRRRVSYTEDDNDDEEVSDEDDEEFMPSDREANLVNNSVEKKRVTYTEVDDDNAEDSEEFVFPGRNKKQRKKSREIKSAVYSDDDDDDNDDDSSDYKAENADVEFMSLGKQSNRENKPMEKKRVSHTELDDGCDDDGGGQDEEDYKEFMFSCGNKKQRTMSREKKRVVYTDDDDDSEAEDADTKANHIRTPTEMRMTSYTEDAEVGEEEEDDYTEFVSLGRTRNLRKKLQEERVVYTEEDEVNDDDDDDDDEYIYSGRKRNKKNKHREKRIVSYKENHEEEDENDAEFKLSESDFVDDEDETPKMKKNKLIRPHPQKKSVPGRQKKSKKLKKPTKPKQQNLRSAQKSVTNKTRMENQSRISKRQKQRAMSESDSDFVDSASSDHEYTISEEEREQMREARVYCGILRPKLRRSSCGNQEKQPVAHKQKKNPIRKGKEKIEDMKDDLGKQVCGICLSEEQRRTMRGVLNCCRHYFCFSCIMEWSKVESRCPVCKQRFSTITKAAKSDTGFDLRTVVVPVPECDQVYEPSEEELRGYLDPYESVICTECQNGGDDALMLLCDICDSSAHTFCVGLGREVPAGNWYCEGCRPTVFGTVNLQHQTPNADRRLGNNASDSLSSPIAGGFDLNELYVPETPLTQQTRVQPEPNPAPTGTIATTLRDRRRIHRQIHHRF